MPNKCFMFFKVSSPILFNNMQLNSCKTSRLNVWATATTGIPAARPHLYETSGLGASIVAAVGLGLYHDFEKAVKAMTHVGDVFEPNMTTYRLYNDLYHDVYKKMYKRLKSLYERIREITGYPK